MLIVGNEIKTKDFRGLVIKDLDKTKSLEVFLGGEFVYRYSLVLTEIYNKDMSHCMEVGEVIMSGCPSLEVLEKHTIKQFGTIELV